MRFSAEVGRTVGAWEQGEERGLGVIVGGGDEKHVGKELRRGEAGSGDGEQGEESWHGQAAERMACVGGIRGGLRGRPLRGGGLESAEAMWRWEEGFNMWQAGLKLSPEPWRLPNSTAEEQYLHPTKK